MNVQLKRLVFALLFWPVPVMAAAQVLTAAPPQVEQQVRDAVLEQWQARAKEAEVRAEQAERRERDAELNRVADQAKQAQTRADTEEQLKLAAQRELFIQEAKAELQNNAYSRLEILIGVFGALITAIVVFFAWNTKETAVAAAKAGVEDIRGKFEERLREAEALVEKIRDHETQASRIFAALSPGEVVKSEEDRKTIADAAREASAKPPRDRTANEFRAMIIDLLNQAKWVDMLNTAQQMRLLHEGDVDFAFASFHEAYALSKLNRNKEAIAGYEHVIARYGAAPEAVLRMQVASAFYNKVCAFAQMGQVAEAITALQSMISAGYSLNLKQIADDTDFDPIRNDAVFKKFMDDNK